LSTWLGAAGGGFRTAQVHIASPLPADLILSRLAELTTDELFSPRRALIDLDPGTPTRLGFDSRVAASSGRFVVHISSSMRWILPMIRSRVTAATRGDPISGAKSLRFLTEHH
jgi:hypothetical protein